MSCHIFDAVIIWIANFLSGPHRDWTTPLSGSFWQSNDGVMEIVRVCKAAYGPSNGRQADRPAPSVNHGEAAPASLLRVCWKFELAAYWKGQGSCEALRSLFCMRRKRKTRMGCCLFEIDQTACESILDWSFPLFGSQLIDIQSKWIQGGTQKEQKKLP